MALKNEHLWAIGGGLLALYGAVKAKQNFDQLTQACPSGVGEAAAGASGLWVWTLAGALGGATAVYAVATKKSPVEAVGKLLGG